MRVLITGGTGFLGSHTVAAVVRAGHDVRLLVRRPERVDPALAPFGLQVADVVAGDVLDALPGTWIVTHFRGTDSSRAGKELGVEPPPLDETLADTIRWMVEAGHLPARFAGRL